MFKIIIILATVALGVFSDTLTQENLNKVKGFVLPVQNIDDADCGESTLACFVSLYKYSQHDYILISERLDLVEYNENYVSDLMVKNFKFNRTHFGLNASGTFKVDLHGLLMANVQAYKFSSNEYRLFALKFPFNLCDVIQKDIFGIQNIYDCGHMFRCPIKKGHYSLCNWGPDYSKFPPHAPRGRYMFSLEWIYYKIKIATYNWYINVQDVPIEY